MSVIPGWPSLATAQLPGLVSAGPGVQQFAGLKEFVAATAGAGTSALKAGTSVPDGSVADTFDLFRLATGIGGTEKEYFRVRRPSAYAQPVVNIDQQGITDTLGLQILNTPAGVGGINIQNVGGGRLVLNAQQGGSPSIVYAENKGLLIHQNANSYDTTTLMKFLVDGATAVASSIPVFDFVSTLAAQANQRLLRVRSNGIERFSVDELGIGLFQGAEINFRDVWGQKIYAQSGYTYFSGAVYMPSGIAANGFAAPYIQNSPGAVAEDKVIRVGTSLADVSVNPAARLLSIGTGIGLGGANEIEKARFRKSGALLVNTDTVNPISFGNAADLASVADGVKFNSGTAILGFFNSNNAIYMGLNIGNGRSEMSGGLLVGGEYECLQNGTGLVLRAPNATRYRLTVTNAGTLSIVAA